MAKVKADARVALLTQQVGQLLEERDGHAMRANAYEAKVNAQAKLIHALKLELASAQARAKAHHDISMEFLCDIKALMGIKEQEEKVTEEEQLHFQMGKTGWERKDLTGMRPDGQ